MSGPSPEEVDSPDTRGARQVSGYVLDASLDYEDSASVKAPEAEIAAVASVLLRSDETTHPPAGGMLEVRNALVTNERRGRISSGACRSVVHLCLQPVNAAERSTRRLTTTLPLLFVERTGSRSMTHSTWNWRSGGRRHWGLSMLRSSVQLRRKVCQRFLEPRSVLRRLNDRSSKQAKTRRYAHDGDAV